METLETVVVETLENLALETVKSDIVVENLNEANGWRVARN